MVPRLRLGRPFVHPFFDLMVIGGGLSLVTVALLSVGGRLNTGFDRDAMVVLLLVTNAAHFAASTVRLYSKPNAFEELRVLTMLLPLLAVVVLTLGIVFPGWIGEGVFQLYLVWSPFHYAAQTYGLASMYAARSDCQLEQSDRRLLWVACLLPFAWAFLQAPTSGLGWLLPPSFWMEQPDWLALRWQVVSVLRPVVFVAPILPLIAFYRRTGRALPLICPLLVFTNAIWWVTLNYVGAFVWATLFHGLQYLAIVLIFHLRDHPPRNEGRAAWVLPALKFYGVSLALGYTLFEVWPFVYVLAGFEFAESVLMCIAVINIHHFIVDRGIWRIRRDPRNRRAAEM